MYVTPAPTISEMIGKVVDNGAERLPELLRRGLVEDGRDYVHWDKLRQLEPPGDLSALARKFGDVFGTDTLALGGQQAPVRCRDRALLVVPGMRLVSGRRDACFWRIGGLWPSLRSSPAFALAGCPLGRTGPSAAFS
jgi:hypothetical protein